MKRSRNPGRLNHLLSCSRQQISLISSLIEQCVPTNVPDGWGCPALSTLIRDNACSFVKLSETRTIQFYKALTGFLVCGASSQLERGGIIGLIADCPPLSFI